MHKLDSVPVDEMFEILGDFKIQTNHIIPVRRPDLVLINKIKITCPLVEYVVSTGQRVLASAVHILRKKIRNAKRWTNSWILLES